MYHLIIITQNLYYQLLTTQLYIYIIYPNCMINRYIYIYIYIVNYVLLYVLMNEEGEKAGTCKS
jgi:hypothetical protein